MWGLPALNLGFESLLVLSSSMRSSLNPHYESSLSACFISAYQLFSSHVSSWELSVSVQRHKEAWKHWHNSRGHSLVLTYSQNIHNSCWEMSSFQTPCFWGKPIKAPCEPPVAALLSLEQWKNTPKEKQHTPRFAQCSLWKPVIAGVRGGRWHSGSFI